MMQTEKITLRNIFPVVENTLLLRVSPIDSFFWLNAENYRQDKERRGADFVGRMEIEAAAQHCAENVNRLRSDGAILRSVNFFCCATLRRYIFCLQNTGIRAEIEAGIDFWTY